MKVIAKYYKCLKFALLDVTFLSLYAMSNPYRIARKFYKKMGEKNVHCYGETPLTTFEEVIDQLSLQPSDTFLELGCGRARSSFWVCLFRPCQIIAVDWIPRFTIPAETLRKWFGLKNLTIVCDDYHHLDFSQVTAAYLYGSDLSDGAVKKITDKFETMPKNSRIVSVSYPLQSRSFEVVSAFPVRFNWGITTAYLQRKKL